MEVIDLLRRDASDGLGVPRDCVRSRASLRSCGSTEFINVFERRRLGVAGMEAGGESNDWLREESENADGGGRFVEPRRWSCGDAGDERAVGDSVDGVVIAGAGDGAVDEDSDKIELKDELRWMREGVLAPPPNFMSSPLPPIAGPLDDPGRDGDPLEVARPLELPGLVNLGIQPFNRLSFATSSLLI